MKNHIEIKVGQTPYDSSIELNGLPLHGVAAIEFRVDARDPAISFAVLTIETTALIKGDLKMMATKFIADED